MSMSSVTGSTPMLVGSEVSATPVRADSISIEISSVPVAP